MIKMAKMTKAQGRRRLKEIEAKMARLYLHDYVSMKDFEAVKRMVKTRTNKLK